jgi:hypothetical protein
MLERIRVALAAIALLLRLQVRLRRAAVIISFLAVSSIRSRSTSSKPRTTSTRSRIPKKSTVAKRTSNGKIKRSFSGRVEFMRRTGYPKGRTGYVVDHIVPLECGGSDSPSNMQWQTVQEAKIKDRSERNCRRE